MSSNNIRIEALNWWNHLSTEDKGNWMAISNDRSINFGRKPNTLTGKEVQVLYTAMKTLCKKKQFECPYSNINCSFIDTAAMDKLSCTDCKHYPSNE